MDQTLDQTLADRIQLWCARIVKAINLTLFWTASALLLFLVVTLFLQVFFRYVLGQPLSWSEEAARIALVWLAMLAACIAAIEGQHFVFRWGTLFLMEKARFWLRIAIDVCIVVVLLLVLKLSIDYLGLVAAQTASGTGLNMRVPYGSISFGMVILIVLHLTEIVDCLAAVKTGRVFSLRETNEAEMISHLRSDPDERS